MLPDSNCEVCRVGVCHFQLTTYTTRQGRHLIILPNVAAQVCDVCGDLTYDPLMIVYVDTLLGRYEQSIEKSKPLDLQNSMGYLSQLLTNRRRSI